MTIPNTLFEQPAIELVIFDCDGVLVDSEILSQRVLLSMLEKLGVVVSEDYFHAHFLGYSFEHVTAKVLADFSVILTDEFRQNYRQALIEIFASELKPTEQLQKMLAQLNINSCVATSGSPEKVKNSLKFTHLDEYFSGKVFTASEVENGKPAPDLFLYSAKKMGVATENCIVIEDSQAGIRAALAANMRVIRFAGASHLKHRDLTSQKLKDVITINDWTQLFTLAPSIFASFNKES